MFSNWSKSISAILYERLTSPWWGTLVITWSIINWKIIYLTIFVGSSEIKGTKIDFIIANYSDPRFLYKWPLIITVGLIAVFPIFEYFIYWLHLSYKMGKYNKKIDVEKKQVLTIEKSAELRLEMAEEKAKNNAILEDKEAELKIKDAQIAELQNRISEWEDVKTKAFEYDENPTFEKQKDYFDELQNLMKNKSFRESIKNILQKVSIHNGLPTDYSPDMIEYYLANDIIEELDTNGKLTYSLTDKGKYFYKKTLESELFGTDNDLNSDKSRNDLS